MLKLSGVNHHPYMDGFGDAVGSAASAVGDALGSVGDAIGDAIGGVADGFSDSFGGYAGIGGQQGAMLGEQTGDFGDFGEAATAAAAGTSQGFGSSAIPGLVGFVTGNPLASLASKVGYNVANNFSPGFGLQSQFGSTLGSMIGSSTGVPGAGAVGGMIGGQVANAAGSGSPTGFAGPGATAGAGDFTQFGGGANILGQLTLPDVLKGGVGVYQALENQRNLERIAEQQAKLADPFGRQRPQYQGQLRRLTSNPQAYLENSPVYQARLKAGQDALRREQAAAGRFFSGNAMREVEQLGSQLASDELDKEYRRLTTLSGAETGSPGTAAQLYGQTETGAAAAKQSALGAAFLPFMQRTAKNQTMLGGYQ